MFDVIDIHTHYVPSAVAALEERGGTLPRMVVESPDCARLYRGAALDRMVDARTWSGERRISDMDARRVRKQVVSPVPVMFAYDCPLDDAWPLLRVTNDGIAELVAAHPGRFSGLAGVPLQDVDGACTETRRAMTELHLAGIEIGSAGTRDIDDPAFDPLWQLCESLDAVVFVHPDERAPGAGRLLAPGLVPAVGYPSETGIIGAKLIMSGFFRRFPHLRIVLAHGGGTLAWMLPRLDRVWNRNPKMKAALDAAPSAYAKRFFYDTITFDADNLSLLAKRTGVDRLMCGTDYPFTLAEDPPGEAIVGAPGFSDAERRAMLHDNAAAVFHHG